MQDFGELPRLSAAQAPAYAKLENVFDQLRACLNRDDFFKQDAENHCRDLSASIQALHAALEIVGAKRDALNWGDCVTGPEHAACDLIHSGYNLEFLKVLLTGGPNFMHLNRVRWRETRQRVEKFLNVLLERLKPPSEDGGLAMPEAKLKISETPPCPACNTPVPEEYRTLDRYVCEVCGRRELFTGVLVIPTAGGPPKECQVFEPHWRPRQLFPANVDPPDLRDRENDKKRSESPSPLQCDILDALRQLKATDQDKRQTGADIAAKVGGDATDQSVKAPLADLKSPGLVESRTGRNGGSWLTPKGLDFINKLRPKP